MAADLPGSWCRFLFGLLVPPNSNNGTKNKRMRSAENAVNYGTLTETNRDAQKCILCRRPAGRPIDEQRSPGGY